MNNFRDWTEADVALHNSRVRKENQIPVKAGGCAREADLHLQILDECRKRGWIALHGSMASPTRRNEGEPDFVILGGTVRVCASLTGELYEDMRSFVLFVEAKTRLGKLSPAQQAFHAHAKKLGHVVHVVRSFQEFLNLL
jgi:hypothetical protein